MLKILPEVKRLLQKHPHLRDSDEKLMATVWFKHIGENKKLPSYESISRCRRKLQEEDPNLRGKEYNLRHKRTEEIKEEVKAMEDLI